MIQVWTRHKAKLIHGISILRLHLIQPFDKRGHIILLLVLRVVPQVGQRLQGGRARLTERGRVGGERGRVGSESGRVGACAGQVE